MTTCSEIGRDLTPARGILISFYVTSIIFNVCLIAQLLTVGIAYFNNPAWWNIHVWLVRGYGGLSLVLLGWSFVAPFREHLIFVKTLLLAPSFFLLPLFSWLLTPDS